MRDLGKSNVYGLTPSILDDTDDKAEQIKVSPHMSLYVEIHPGCEVKSSGKPG